MGLLPNRFEAKDIANILTAPKPDKPELSFAEQVDECLAGKLPFYTALKVCDTPQILLDIGCRQLPMLYTQRHLKDAIKPANNEEHFHGLTIEQIKMMPELIAKPVMAFDSISRDDSIVLVTSELDTNENPVIISIKPNGKRRYEVEDISSNFITSIYPKDNFMNLFKKVLSEDKLLFCHKERSQKMFERWGVQSSELTNTLDFNIIIHQSRNIVNPISEKTAEILSESKSEDDQLSLFDLDTETQSTSADTYITDNFSAENAKAALTDYAESRIAYYDGAVREAFLNNDLGSFNANVRKAVDETISEVLGGELDIAEELKKAYSGFDVEKGTSREEFSELYKEMYENSEFAEALYADISEKLYAAHVEIDKARQAAHSV